MHMYMYRYIMYIRPPSEEARGEWTPYSVTAKGALITDNLYFVAYTVH